MTILAKRLLESSDAFIIDLVNQRLVSVLEDLTEGGFDTLKLAWAEDPRLKGQDSIGVLVTRKGNEAALSEFVSSLEKERESEDYDGWRGAPDGVFGVYADWKDRDGFIKELTKTGLVKGVVKGDWQYLRAVK